MDPMDPLNHNAPGPSGEQHHSSWSDEMVTVPPSLLAGVLKGINTLPPGRQDLNQPELMQALHDTAWYVRTAAVQRLGNLGEQAPLEPLLAALGDEHVSVRAAAVYALGQLGPRTPLDVLVRSLQDEEWQVRERAVLALSLQEARFPALQNAFYDPDRHVREMAAYTLQSLSTIPLQESGEATSSAAIGAVQPAIMEIPTKNNLLKKTFYELKPNKNPTQFFTGVTPIMELHQMHYRSTVTKDTTRKSGTRILTSTIVAVAVIAVLFFSWIQATQYLHRQASTLNKNHPSSASGIAEAPVQHKPGDTLYTYPDPYHVVYSAAWSPDDKRVVLADGGSVVSMDALTGAHKINYIANPDNYPGSVHTSVSWSPNGSRIAGSSSRLYVWDAASGQPIVSYQPPLQSNSTQGSGNGVIVSTTWSPDSKLLAFATNGGPYGFNVYVWNPQSQQIVFTQILNSRYVSNTSVAWSPNGKYLAFIAGTTVHIWDIGQNQPAGQFPAAAFTWSPDSKHIAATNPSDGATMDGVSIDPNYGPGVVVIWDLASGKEVKHFQVVDMSQQAVSVGPLTWSPDGKHLLVVSTDITEWDMPTGANVLHYTGHPSTNSSWPRDVAWSHDGQMVASVGGGQIGQASLKVWVPVQ